jgi:hypothetical protein
VSSDHVIEAIDNALADYTSADAMRWRPDAHAEAVHQETMRRHWGPLVDAMRPLTQWALSTEGQVALASMAEAREAEQACHCFCAVSHPGQWPCEGYVLADEVVAVRCGAGSGTCRCARPAQPPDRRQQDRPRRQRPVTDHRLAWEARRAASLFRMGALLELAAAGYLLSAWTQTPSTAAPPSQALVSLAAVPFSCLLAVRWKRRATWYTTTRRWWQRLDEAPPIIPLPRVHAWANKPLTWRGTALLLGVPLMAAIAIRAGRS